jgi:hypothetical protein
LGSSANEVGLDSSRMSTEPVLLEVLESPFRMQIRR